MRSLSEKGIEIMVEKVSEILIERNINVIEKTRRRKLIITLRL